MIRAEIRDATAIDVDAVGINLREPDRDELSALGRTDHLAAVRAAVTLSFETKVGLINGIPICLFGVGRPSMMTSLARPWMLSAIEIDDHPIVFLLHSKRIVAGWRSRFDVLENWIDARNYVSIAWLRWMGFTIEEAKAFGPYSLPFHRFLMRRENV